MKNNNVKIMGNWNSQVNTNTKEKKKIIGNFGYGKRNRKG